MLPLGLKHNTMLITGAVMSLVPTIWAMLELQSRWCARVLSGRLRLPSEKKMLQEIQRGPRIERRNRPVSVDME